MKLINTRSLVAALGLSLLAQGAWAQTATNATPQVVAPTTPARQAKRDEMAKHQQALLEKLNLSPAQKIQYDAVQSARQDLRKQKQTNMIAHQKSMSEQVAKEQMDPRAVIEADKQSRAIMDTKRVAADQKWLSFWDGLTAEQRKTITADMKARQEHHAQKPHGAPHG